MGLKIYCGKKSGGACRGSIFGHMCLKNTQGYVIRHTMQYFSPSPFLVRRVLAPTHGLHAVLFSNSNPCAQLKAVPKAMPGVVPVGNRDLQAVQNLNDPGRGLWVGARGAANSLVKGVISRSYDASNNPERVVYSVFFDFCFFRGGFISIPLLLTFCFPASYRSHWPLPVALLLLCTSRMGTGHCRTETKHGSAGTWRHDPVSPRLPQPPTAKHSTGNGVF